MNHTNGVKSIEIGRSVSPWEYFCTLWTYTEIMLLSVVFFAVELVCFILLYPFDKTRYVVGRIFRYSSVVSVKLNPLWTLRINGKIPPMPTRTVVVGNHLSLVDTALICHLPWDMKWLSKSEIFSIPFVGWGMYLAGDVKLYRGNRSSSKTALGQMKTWIDKGANVMIFPEGTRSRSGVMGEFKDGAFRLAIEAQSDVLPVAVVGTDTALKADGWKMGKAYGLVTVGKAISTKNMTFDDIGTLRDQARKQIEEMIARTKPLVEMR